MAKFIPLHIHSEFSLLDGTIRIGDLVNYAKENELPAIAVTDHGVMSVSYTHLTLPTNSLV